MFLIRRRLGNVHEALGMPTAESYMATCHRHSCLVILQHADFTFQVLSCHQLVYPRIYAVRQSCVMSTLPESASIYSSIPHTPVNYHSSKYKHNVKRPLCTRVSSRKFPSTTHSPHNIATSSVSKNGPRPSFPPTRVHRATRHT